MAQFEIRVWIFHMNELARKYSMLLLLEAWSCWEVEIYSRVAKLLAHGMHCGGSCSEAGRSVQDACLRHSVQLITHVAARRCKTVETKMW